MRSAFFSFPGMGITFSFCWIPGDNMGKLAWAVCSDEDSRAGKYCPSAGEHIAFARVSNETALPFAVPRNQKGWDYMQTILQEFAENMRSIPKF